MAHSEVAGEGEEEHHGSPWPVIIAVGMGVGYVGIVLASIPILLVGVAIFGSGAGGWVHQDLQRPSSAFYGVVAAVESKFPRVSARKLGIWLFLVTEIMFFSAIIGSSWTLRLRTGTPGLPSFQGLWATPGEILNVPLTGANTFILICSSITRKAFKGGFTKENHEAVELAGLYWHFVDVVWIFLFTIVYLI